MVDKAMHRKLPNKQMLEKTEGQRMQNPEKLATLGTQDTGRRETKQKQNTENKKTKTKYRKQKI